MSLWPRWLWPNKLFCDNCGRRLRRGEATWDSVAQSAYCWQRGCDLDDPPPMIEPDPAPPPSGEPSMMSSASSWVANPTQSSSSRPSIVDADGRTWEIVDGDGRPIPASTKYRELEVVAKERPLRRLDTDNSGQDEDSAD